MSRKGDLLYLGQMLDTVRRIEEKTAGLTLLVMLSSPSGERSIQPQVANAASAA